MLKTSASVVLASFRPSTYPRGYASGLHSLRPCWTNVLSILREWFTVVPRVRSIKILAWQHVFFRSLLVLFDETFVRLLIQGTGESAAFIEEPEGELWQTL